MRTSFVDLPSGPVHSLDFGGSGRTVVLVHGLGGSAINWTSLGPLLAQRARVLAVDLGGFGRTPLQARSANIHANRELLSAYLDQVAPAEQIILIGNSMGGLISMLHASADPARIEGLVLIAPSVPRPSGVKLDPTVLKMFALYAVPYLGEWFVAARAKKAGPEAVARETLKLCTVDVNQIEKEVYAAHLELARERADKMPWGQRAFLEAARSIVRLVIRPEDFRKRTAGIRAPTLVIQGHRDRLVPAGAVEALCRDHADWQLLMMPDIGHVPMLEAPAQVAARIFTWLDELPAGR